MISNGGVFDPIVVVTNLKQNNCLVLGFMKVTDIDDDQLEKDKRVKNNDDEFDVDPKHHALLPDEELEEVRVFSSDPYGGFFHHASEPIQASIVIKLVVHDLIGS